MNGSDYMTFSQKFYRMAASLFVLLSIVGAIFDEPSSSVTALGAITFAVLSMEE